jgi:DNA polymerase-3 subunit delta
MIIFLFGEDDFRAKRKLAQLKDKFLKEVDKSGGSLEWVDGERAVLKEIAEKSSGGSLLAPKRMVVIENIFRTKTKDLLPEVLKYFQAKEKSGNDNIVVFLENFIKTKKKYNSEETVKMDADGREKPLTKAEKELFNFFSTVKVKQEFHKMNNMEMSSWIREEAAARGGKVSVKGANALITATGGDLWQIDKELNKLINYKTGQKSSLPASGMPVGGDEISDEDVEQLVKGQFEDNIFALTDAIGSRQRSLAVKLLEEEFLSGANELYVLSMIVRQVKIIIQARAALDKGMPSRAMAAELKLNPFVASKAADQARNFKMDDLKKILSGLIDIDFAVKTGRGEAGVMLGLLVAKL